MNEADTLAVAAFNAMMSKLEVIYPSYVTDAPPDKYSKALAWALLSDDGALLMEVLDSEDINPWDIEFVEDGLSEESPDQQSMIEFAARKKSWACVANLIEHFHDCDQGAATYTTLAPIMAEYEIATDHERIEYLEAVMNAANVGYAHFLARHGGFGGVYQPPFPNTFPKSARFIFRNFSAIHFSGKGLGPIANKRLSLHQRTLAAISANDRAQLESLLGILNANSMASQLGKRAPQDALSTHEIETFITVALACDYPSCVNAILSKVVQFKKSQTMARLAAKKVDDDKAKRHLFNGNGLLADMILHVATTVDQHCKNSKVTPAASIEAAVDAALFSALSEMSDRVVIDTVKAYCQEHFSSMKSCVDHACGRAKSFIEREELVEFVPENDQAVRPMRQLSRL